MLGRLADAKCLTQASVNSFLLNSPENSEMDIKAVRIRNLKDVISAKSESAADFCRTYGIDPSHLSQIINGHRGFGEKAARKIEDQVGLPAYSLDSLTSKDVVSYTSQKGYVPLISHVQAGTWCESPDNYAPGDAEQWLPAPKEAGPRSFALKVVNDSMKSPFPGERSYPPGTIIYVDPDKAITNGCRVIARANGEYTFKSYVEDAGRKYLKPINPTYDKIDITEDVHICGVVIGSYLPE